MLGFYRSLSGEDRKIFDQALTISEDGLPTLEIVLREESETANPPIAVAGAAAISPPAPRSAPARKTKTPAVGSSAKQAAKPAKKAVAKTAPKSSVKKPAPKRKK